VTELACDALPRQEVHWEGDVYAQGGILTVRVKVHGADPGDYVLSVHPLSKCGGGWELGRFKVDARGYGEKSGSVDVSGFGRSFAANAAGAGHPNLSVPVNL